MTLIKGVLASYDDPLLGVLPTVIPFQYNPVDVTRTFLFDSAAATPTACGNAAALNQASPAQEDYSLTLELDATDALEHGRPLTSAFGISLRLAALEMLMQPVRSSPLAQLVGGLIGGGGAVVPTSKLPFVLFIWGPTRITPVRLKSLTIHETAFDELLNPIHATADLGLTVLRTLDLARDDAFGRAAVNAYHGARELRAALQLPQLLELV